MKIKNRDGIVSINSNNVSIDNSIKNLTSENSKQIDEKINDFVDLLNSLEKEIGCQELVPIESRNNIKKFIEVLKSQADPKQINEKMFTISMEGLFEATKELAKLSPKIINIVVKLKELF